MIGIVKFLQSFILRVNPQPVAVFTIKSTFPLYSERETSARFCLLPLYHRDSLSLLLSFSMNCYRNSFLTILF
jgi:hypothetical protein